MDGKLFNFEINVGELATESDYLIGGEFWIGLIGVVVGALLSGAISYWLQKQQFDRENSIYAKETLATNQSSSMVVCNKLLRIISNLIELDNTLKTCKKEAHKENLDQSKPWLFINAMTPIPQHINFADAEIAFCYRNLNSGLAGDIFDLARTHFLFIEIMTIYSKDRKIFLESLRDGTPMEFNEAGVLTSYICALNSFAEKIEAAKKTIAETCDLLGRKFDIEFNPSFKNIFH